MPKMKTHKGTAKRMKITGSGKVLRQRSFSNHMLSKKSSRRKRNINTSCQVTGKVEKNIKKVLGV